MRLYRLPTRLKDFFRAAPLLVIFLLAFFSTALMNPAKVGLLIWGLAKLGFGGYAGYWIDRLIFPYARPHALTGVEAGIASKRRAAIVASAILAAALTP